GWRRVGRIKCYRLGAPAVYGYTMGFRYCAGRPRWVAGVPGRHPDWQLVSRKRWGRLVPRHSATKEDLWGRGRPHPSLQSAWADQRGIKSVRIPERAAVSCCRQRCFYWRYREQLYEG